MQDSINKTLRQKIERILISYVRKDKNKKKKTVVEKR